MPELTDGAWLLLADLLTQTGVAAASPEADALDLVRLAAAAQVERARPDLAFVSELDASVSYAPTADVYLGALMLAARLYARKGSPTGLASYGEFGPAAVIRFDPDVERLLGVGRYAPPRVG